MSAESNEDRPMSMGEAMRFYDDAMQPVYDALDGAVRAIRDIESIEEGVERHLQWWADELAVARAER